MLFGTNPMADVLLATLGLDRKMVGRFRDCFLQDGKDGPEVHVYTRNGGGNRECWSDEEAQDGKPCTCPGCIITSFLPGHPEYLGDADDDFDPTYATIRFSLPEKFRAVLAGFARPADAPDASQRWVEMLERIKSNPDAPEAKAAAEAFASVFEKLTGRVDL